VGLSSWIAHKSVWSPQNVAVRFGSNDITYAMFEARIAHLSGYLLDHQGIRSGDRIAFLGPNAPELLDLFFACARIGAIFVPLNSRMTARQLAVMLANCRPRCMFAHPSLWTTAEGCRDAVETMQLVPFSDDPADDDSLLRVDKLIGTERPVACSPPADQNVPVLIAYTSGTTGTPKGAVYTQDAITFSAINSNTSFNMRSRDHVLTFLPMFHVGGLLIQTLPAFHVGATVTIHRTFDAGKVLRAIHDRAVTLILPPPAMSKALSSHPAWPETNLSSIRCVAIGSTIVSAKIMQPG
jgi:fatty-acyl-CoA synthase